MPIRKARPEDDAAIASVRLACWQATYTGMIPDMLLTPKFMIEFIGRRQQVLAERGQQETWFVAEDVANAEHAAEGIVGYAAVGPALDSASAYTGELYEVYVLPHAQKRGLGQQLLHRAACALVAQGHSSMRLYVLAENWTARHFYERLGGTVIEERTVEVHGTQVPDVAYGWHAIREIPGLHCD